MGIDDHCIELLILGSSLVFLGEAQKTDQQKNEYEFSELERTKQQYLAKAHVEIVDMRTDDKDEDAPKKVFRIKRYFDKQG